MSTPTLLITKPEWSQFPYVVFDNNIDDCIPEEWVSERYEDDRENSKIAEETTTEDGDYDYECVYDDSITIESTRETMESEFVSDNPEIEHHWPGHQIVAIAGYLNYDYQFYSYLADGTATHVLDGSIDELTEYLNDQ